MATGGIKGLKTIHIIESKGGAGLHVGAEKSDKQMGLSTSPWLYRLSTVIAKSL